MIFAGKTTGVVTVQNYEENAFSYTDLSRIRLLAGYISTAVEKPQGYTEKQGILLLMISLRAYITGGKSHSIGHAISQGLRKTDDPISVVAHARRGQFQIHK